MERSLAVTMILEMMGVDLHDFARRYAVTVTGSSGNVNKGWAGHVIERHLGLPINSTQSPDFGSWELKVVPLKYLKNGSLVFKETMAVTIIDPQHVMDNSFHTSHLLEKLRRALIVTRIVGDDALRPSYIHTASPVDLEGELYEAVAEDYEEVRACVSDPERGFEALTGRMGRYIQPRTKGQGHGSTSRAFYARKEFLRRVTGLES